MGDVLESTLVNRSEEILEDSGNVFFDATLISSQMQDGVSEISQFVPNKVKHIINVFDGSRELDLSTISGLNKIRKIEYPVGNWPKDWRNVPEDWGDTVELDIDTAPSASSLGSLTGTVTFSDGSTAITGSGTAFTTELEEGWYIKKSSSSTWHRISTITDDTNLVLVTQVATADDGADTADATDYWYEYAYLYCSKVHTLSILTDLKGAIDKTGGYEAGAMLIHIDSLQDTGTLKKNTVFTIAGVSKSYRVTEDATIASNECDVKISPSLSGDVANTAVVTIKPSSLTSELERILPELVAGRVAKNAVGDIRTQINSAISAIGSAATQVGLMDARNTQMVADVASARSAVSVSLEVAKEAIASGKEAVGKMTDRLTQVEKDVDRTRDAVGANLPSILSHLEQAEDQVTSAVTQCDAIVTGIGTETSSGGTIEKALELANTQLIQGINDLSVMQSDITDNDEAFDLALTNMNTALDNAQTAISSGDSLINTIPIGGGPVNKYHNAAMAGVNLARGFANEASALATEKNDYGQLAIAQYQSSRVSILEAQVYIALEGAITRENAQAVSSYIQAGQGYIRTANSLIQVDSQQVGNLSRVFGGELSTVVALGNQASGNFREAAAYISADAQQVASFGRVAGGELSTISGYLNNSIGFYREATSRLSVTPAINSLQRWANDKIAQAKEDLRRISVIRVKQYFHPTS